MSTFDVDEALIATGLALWSACIVGNPCQHVKDLYDWMKVPVIGSLVLETTSRTTTQDRVGILEKIETISTCRHMHVDPNITCNECTGGDDDYRWMETYYWLRVADGHLHRWYNCRFIRIPRSDLDWREVRDKPLREAEAARERVEQAKLTIARRGF